jgi:hypothetical protein
MTQEQPITKKSIKSEGEVAREQPLSPTPIDRIPKDLLGNLLLL